MNFTMVDEVHLMSDAELRTKLAEHGFPVMPVTDSTRKILIRKLKTVLENKDKSRLSVMEEKSGGADVDNMETSEVYSSDEEYDFNDERNSPLPSTTTKGRHVAPKIDSPYATNDYNDSETGSDSDVVTDESAYFPSLSLSSRAAASPIKESMFSKLSLSDVSSEVNNRRNTPKDMQSITNLSSFHSASLHKIRSRLSPSSLNRGSTTYSSRFNTSAYQPTTIARDEIDSPYLSDFARRLAASKSDSKLTYLDYEINNSSPNAASNTYVIAGITGYINSIVKKFRQNSFMSLALVFIVALFLYFFVY